MAGASKDKILVVGADGLIGKGLMEYLSGLGKDVIRTTRRKERQGSTCLLLDLAAGVEGWEVPEGIAAAVICAGIGLVKQCEADPQGTASVNVEGTVKLVRKFIDKGIFVVVLSSNQVFDGKRSFEPAEAPYSTVSEYGRQKVALEKAVLGWDQVAVVRLTKVLEQSNALFVSWKEQLGRGVPINPFSDVYVSPIMVESVVKVLGDIIERRLGGIWQVCGRDEISYAQAAYLFAELKGFPPALIRPVSVNTVVSLCDVLPRHGSLDARRIRDELGANMPEAKEVIRVVFGR